jgi:hypothetical protein
VYNRLVTMVESRRPPDAFGALKDRFRAGSRRTSDASGGPQ